MKDRTLKKIVWIALMVFSVSIWFTIIRGNYVRKLHTVTEHRWARNDAYGIYTGLFCDKCYEDPSKYTYRKDRYHDEAYCGERLDEDY